jgi:hydrogenase-1 operon protein HyaE
MSRPLIEALTTRHGLATVDEASVDQFLDAALDRGCDAVLFMPGDIKRRPEGNDVAVVLPELLLAFGDRLAGAVVSQDSEEALKMRFGVLVLPSLVFMRGRKFLGVIPRIKDWSVYLDEIEELLAGDGVPLPVPAVVNGAAPQQGEKR